MANYCGGSLTFLKEHEEEVRELLRQHGDWHDYEMISESVDEETALRLVEFYDSDLAYGEFISDYTALMDAGIPFDAHVMGASGEIDETFQHFRLTPEGKPDNGYYHVPENGLEWEWLDSILNKDVTSDEKVRELQLIVDKSYTPHIFPSWDNQVEARKKFLMRKLVTQP